MKRIHLLITGLILLEILLLFMGCQGHNLNPLVPTPDPDEMMTDDIVPFPFERTTASMPNLWGYYEVIYDSVGHSIEAVPLRGPAFALNVVTFLQPPAGSQYNMNVDVLDDAHFPDEGLIDIRVLLHHPFPGQNIYTGFDVCGIFITEGTIQSPVNSSLTYADPSIDPSVLNPDGHTRWMNPTEFISGDIFGFVPGFWGMSESSENSGFVAGATLNPYKYFAQGLSPGEDVWEWLEDDNNVYNRGMFPAGATCSRDYELRFPIIGNEINFMFDYAVLAHWEPPLNEPIIDPVIDFPPDANARYPLHIRVTDNSEVWYTGSDAGGNLRFEVEVFDRDALTSPGGVPEQVTGFKIWSDDPLIPGGSIETMSTEVEWNSGFIASTSVANIEILNAVPEASGTSNLWIAVGSTDPNSYDQGLGASVPYDPIETCFMVPVQIASCPKAFMSDVGNNQAGSGTWLNDVPITGEHFVDGIDLGVWLEFQGAGGSALGDPEFTVIGTDVKYIDADTVTADFNFNGAPYGDYGVGCTNGCGEVTEPGENDLQEGDFDYDVLPQVPDDVTLRTGRELSSDPATITELRIDWTQVTDAISYFVYFECFDVAGDVVSSIPPIETTEHFYVLPIGSVPMSGGGTIKTWITATVPYDSEIYESMPSQEAMMIFQGFETAMGEWSLLAEDPSTLRFARSTVQANFDGSWGVKILGNVPWTPPRWILMASPPIPEIDGTDTVMIEFVHRYLGILPSNGYQVGWIDILPVVNDTNVPEYQPVIEAAYGHQYNSMDCPSLRTEFLISVSEDNNFQSNSAYFDQWWLSGFEASGVVGDEIENRLVVGFAGNYFDLVDVHIDDVAILIY